MPNAESRTEVTVKGKCDTIRKKIEDGQYKYGDRDRGSGCG